MSTPLQDIYDRFWSKVEEESTISSLREDDMVEELFLIYKSAASAFTIVRKDLETITETTQTVNSGTIDEYTYKVRTLEDDLTELEKEILSYLMIVTFLQRKVVNENFYEALELTTKDFKQLSKANQMDKVNNIIKDYETRAEKKISLYGRIMNDKGSIRTFIDEMSDL